MPKASPSTRATDNVTLVHGMVNIPLTLYSGTVKTKTVERHRYLSVPVMEEVQAEENGKPAFEADGTTPKMIQVQKTVEVEKDDGTKEQVPVFKEVNVGNGYTNKETGELLDENEKAQVQNKVETEYGPVYVEDHEIETLFTLEPKTLTVTAFQPITLFTRGEYIPRDVLHTEPSKVTKKRSERVDKLATTFFEAMREEGVMAVCELITRGVPKPCVLMPDGRLWILYYTEQTREQRELPEVEVNPAEVGMMRQLIGMALETDTLDIANVRDPLIQAFAEEKAAAGDFGKPEDTTRVVEVQEPSTDLMAMLQASVDAAKAERAEAV